MGVQSLLPEDLKYLGRNHSVQDALECYRIARGIFDKISFDLIYARHPRQTVDSWRAELRQALDLNPTHLSLYSLTYEPGTPFHRSLERGLRTFFSNCPLPWYSETQRGVLGPTNRSSTFVIYVVYLC
jgi:oxygen-independent coproporphyrinogen-3 oxidase